MNIRSVFRNSDSAEAYVVTLDRYSYYGPHGCLWRVRWVEELGDWLVSEFMTGYPPMHRTLKQLMAPLTLVVSHPSEPAPSCSVCRRDHGPEVQHACE